MVKGVLRTNEVMKDLCALFDLPHTKVRRLVLELTAGEPVVVGVEMMPDKADADALVAGFTTVVDRHYLVRTGDMTYKPVDEAAQLVEQATETTE